MHQQLQNRIQELADEQGDIDLGELCSAFLQAFHGYHGIATECHNIYFDSGTSPNVKANLLKGMLGFFEANARINKDNRASESQMSDEELQELSAVYLRQLPSTVETPPPVPSDTSHDNSAAPQAAGETAPAV